MGNVIVVVVVVIVVTAIIWRIRRHPEGIVAKRGLSIGADLGSLADKPRVRVRSLTQAGPERYRLILTPESDALDGAGPGPDDMDLLVMLKEEEFGFELLHRWKQAHAVVAVVRPAEGRLVRLRSVDDLQPLTLSCIERSEGVTGPAT